MNVIKLNFVHTILFIELRRAVTLKLMLPLQQIWNLLHRFSGCFFEATTVYFSQKVKKYLQVFDPKRALIKFVELTDSSSNTQQTITLLAFASREHHVIRKKSTDVVSVTMSMGSMAV